jgi:hypothetical protein
MCLIAIGVFRAIENTSNVVHFLFHKSLRNPQRGRPYIYVTVLTRVPQWKVHSARMYRFAQHMILRSPMYANEWQISGERGVSLRGHNDRTSRSLVEVACCVDRPCAARRGSDWPLGAQCPV